MESWDRHQARCIGIYRLVGPQGPHGTRQGCSGLALPSLGCLLQQEKPTSCPLYLFSPFFLHRPASSM